MAKSKKVKKKRKLNKKRFYLFIIILILLVFFIYKLFNTNIKNIYISGNIFYTDQEIIDIAKIKDYPKSIYNISSIIKKRLKSDTYILDAKVKYKGFLDKVYIEVKENYPLFYYNYDKKLVLYDGSKVNESKTVLTVINQIPDVIYSKFIDKMKKVDLSILNRISEIKYDPIDVDEERFLIFMNDGNYVYINLKKFLNINKYIDMIKSFEGKKGILYLDSGEYFDVFDE